MSRYRKLFVAALGLGLLALRELAEVNIPYASEDVVTVLLSVLTAFGVYRVPNDA